MMRLDRFVIAIFLVVIVAGILLREFLLVAGLLVVFAIVIGMGVAIPQMRFFGDFICRGSKSKRQIALTFDDGPDPKSTPQLLDLLLDENVPAAFFCVGKRVEENPTLALRIVFENHLLENHSYAHSNFTNFFTTSRLEEELVRAQSAIKKATGQTPKFFRPPMGLSNPNTFRAAKNLDLKVVGWSIRSLDTVMKGPKKVVQRIVSRLEPGAIILLHDGKIPADRLVATVKSLLDELRKLNYEIVRLDEIIK